MSTAVPASFLGNLILEGCGSPLSVRLCDLQVSLLPSTFLSTFSAVKRLPSCNTLEARISQFSPSLTQVDSPKPR